MKIKSKVSIIDNEIPEAQNEVENRDHEENTEDKTINNENPEDQNEDENLDLCTLYPTVSKKCATLIWANDFDEQTLRGGVLKTHIPS